VLEEFVHHAVPVITIGNLQDSLQISSEAATRIVQRLVSAGILVKAPQAGTWVKVSP
jgi:predicted transcriptional regulator